MFEKVLEFKKAILLCYGQQKNNCFKAKGFLKVEIWAIIKAFTSILNRVVSICVMNQSEGHWLLSDVLNKCINLTLTLEVKVGHATNVFDVFDAFDAKLIIFQNNMWAKVVKVIKLFLYFLQSYDSH
jgi:hypothetical protein